MWDGPVGFEGALGSAFSPGFMWIHVAGGQEGKGEQRAGGQVGKGKGEWRLGG